jgi:hypothetical protein
MHCPRSNRLPYFDFALNEQCFQYNDCAPLLPFIKAGKAVFQVEYENPKWKYVYHSGPFVV